MLFVFNDFNRDRPTSLEPKVTGEVDGQTVAESKVTDVRPLVRFRGLGVTALAAEKPATENGEK
jgi:hypothetical protein